MVSVKEKHTQVWSVSQKLCGTLITLLFFLVYKEQYLRNWSRHKTEKLTKICFVSPIYLKRAKQGRKNFVSLTLIEVPYKNVKNRTPCTYFRIYLAKQNYYKEMAFISTIDRPLSSLNISRTNATNRGRHRGLKIKEVTRDCFGRLRSWARLSSVGVWKTSRQNNRFAVGRGTGPCFIRIRTGCGPPNINRQLSEMKQSVAQSAIRAPRNDRQGKH